mgnify:CR=1 FL=1
MVVYDEAYVEKLIQDQLKRGKGSQKQAIVAVASESTPLENPHIGQKSRHCGFFKMNVLQNVSADSIEKFVQKAIYRESVLFTDKYPASINLERWQKVIFR